MKVIESILKPIEGHLLSFNRDTVQGWYELQIGVPKKWIFNETDEIGCEIISENEIGKLIKIFPKINEIVIDDLILFVQIIIETNMKISDKEKEMKETLEKQANEFFKELEDMQKNLFKNFNNKPIESKAEKV